MVAVLAADQGLVTAHGWLPLQSTACVSLPGINTALVPEIRQHHTAQAGDHVGIVTRSRR
jgi:hypothetical protein